MRAIANNQNTRTVRKSLLRGASADNVHYRVDNGGVQGPLALRGLGNISAQPQFETDEMSVMAKVEYEAEGDLDDASSNGGPAQSRLSFMFNAIPVLRRASQNARLSEVTPATIGKDGSVLEAAPLSRAATKRVSTKKSSGGGSAYSEAGTDPGHAVFAVAKKSTSANMAASRFKTGLRSRGASPFARAGSDEASGESVEAAAGKGVAADNNVHKFSIMHEVSTEHHRYILDWDSRFRRNWDILIVVLVIYLCFTVPMSIAFIDMKFNSVFGTLADIVFYTDMVLNFRTSFIHHGCNIRDPKEIAKHYVESGWLAVDVLASIPFEKIFEGGFDKSARKSIKILKWLKIPKLLRMGRVLRYLKSYAKYYRLFILLAVTLFSLHMLGCMFLSITDTCAEVCSDDQMWNFYYLSLRMSYLLVFQVCDPFYFLAHVDRGYYEQLDTKTRFADGGGGGTNASLARLLSGSGGGNGTVGGDPDDAAYTQLFDTKSGLPHFYGNDAWSVWTFFDDEHRVQVYGLQLLSWAGMSLGFWLIVNFIAEAVSFTASRMNAYNTFFNKVGSLQREMGRLSIPMETQYRVKRYYDYLWINGMFSLNQKGGGILGDKDLSKALQKELALQIYGELLSSISIFANANDDCLFAVAMRLKILVFLPGDAVFEKGNVAHELYIIKKGVIAVNFGEIDAFEASKSDGAASVKDDAARKALAGDTDDEYKVASELEDSATLNLMGPGCFFGEIALLTTMPRSCTVYSKTVSELHELSKEDFDEVMDEHPALLDDFRRNVLAMYPGLRSELEKTDVASLGASAEQAKANLEREATLRGETVEATLLKRGGTISKLQRTGTNASVLSARSGTLKHVSMKASHNSTKSAAGVLCPATDAPVSHDEVQEMIDNAVLRLLKAIEK